MRLRFWRKKQAEKFDPEAAEIPEFLEVWPETSFSWRAFGVSAFWGTCRGAVAVVLVNLTLRVCDNVTSQQQRPTPLVVLEAARLDDVCAEGSHFLALRRVAPCDAESRSALQLQPDSTYYVVFADRLIGSYSIFTPGYLLEGECYDAIEGQSESVEHCVVAELTPRPP